MVNSALLLNHQPVEAVVLAKAVHHRLSRAISRDWISPAHHWRPCRIRQIVFILHGIGVSRLSWEREWDVRSTDGDTDGNAVRRHWHQHIEVHMLKSLALDL